MIADGYDDEVDRLRTVMNDGQGWVDRVAAEETLPAPQRAQVEQHTAEKLKQHHDKEVKPCPVQVRRHGGGQNDGRILPKGKVIISVAAALYTFIMTMVIMNTAG